MDVADLVCLDTMERPFEGTNYSYEVYLITVQGTGRKV